MNIAVLRATGSAAALAAVRSALNLDVDREWKKGDPGRRGAVNEDSGFNACVADVDNPAALMVKLREFLATCKTSGAILASPELSTQLDVGLSVGGSRQFSASLILSPSDLGLFAELGMELSVSAYPVSDEVTGAGGEGAQSG